MILKAIFREYSAATQQASGWRGYYEIDDLTVFVGMNGSISFMRAIETEDDISPIGNLS